MDWNELIERLNGYEWNDVEFKQALEHCPINAYETVSAFANTSGGWLVFGVTEDNGRFEIIGVQKVNQVETEFLSNLHQAKKINFFPAVREGKITDGTRTVLTFFIPEAPRASKPVYLNGDIRKSYIRRGSGDHQCSEEEIKTFLREAASNRYDSELLSLDVTTCFDEESIRWYRTQWQPRNPDKLVDVNQHDFLKYFGLIVDNAGKLSATRAAILLFGSDSVVMTILPRPVADFRRLSVPFDLGIPDEKRWEDRGIMECNLVTAWRRILEHYRKVADVPFSLDATTLERKDRPLDYTAFREALINLLTHQDYGDQTRKASIQVFRDRIIFWNPGSSFVTREEMFTPGDRPVRNPRIVNAFRRIGLGEQAGTGMGAIYSNWRQLKRVPPMIENDKSGHSFSLHLLSEEIVSEEQLLFQANLGVHLTEDEAGLFAQIWREGQIWPLEARAVTGLSGTDTDTILNHLVVQRLIEQREGLQGRHYVLAAHIREMIRTRTEPVTTTKKVTNLVTDQVGRKDVSLITDQAQPLTNLTEPQRRIVQFCDSAKPIALIMRHLGVSNRTFFRRAHLDPLVKSGVLKTTFPDSPQHPKQAYVLTDTGLDLKKKFDVEVKAQEEPN
jgi:ATP-dependent DNA helicase RecG